MEELLSIINDPKQRKELYMNLRSAEASEELFKLLAQICVNCNNLIRGYKEELDAIWTESPLMSSDNPMCIRSQELQTIIARITSFEAEIFNIIGDKFDVNKYYEACTIVDEADIATMTM